MIHRARYGRCSQCGFDHWTNGDVLACDAIHGQVCGWPFEVRDPHAVCALCGVDDRMSELLWHMKHQHSHQTIGTGRLIRYVEDTVDLSRYDPGTREGL